MYIEENVKTAELEKAHRIEMPNPATRLHTTTARGKSDYELKRGKPMPSKHHSIIQLQLGYILKRDYGKQFQFLSELDLGFKPKGATPDICVYPKMQLDFKKDADEIKMTEPPLTTVEILSSEQALNELIFKVQNIYFPNHVNSAWVIIPRLKSIVLFLPGQDEQYFNSGKLKDPATGIEVSVPEVFEV